MMGNKYKILVHIILFVLLIIWVGKAWFAYNPNIFLYIYGILVTTVVLVTFFIAFLVYEDPYELARQLPASRKKQYLVTCMVAVKNEEKIIAQCIESLVNQTYKNKEIIIVNDGSTDGTREILDLYSTQQLISVIHLEKNVGKKKALAHAMLLAKGDLFVLTDSDSIVALDAVEKMVDIFNLDPEIGAASGHCRALNGNSNLLTKAQDAWYEGQFAVRKAFESVFGAVTCVSGPLAVFRREAIFNYIPAWESDTFLGQEFKFATDRTLTGFVLGGSTVGAKLKQKYAWSPFVERENYPLREWKVVYTKATKAWTQVPDTFRKMLRQQIRWKKSFIRNLFFTGAFYWKKPLIASAVYYLHAVFVLLGPLVAFRHIFYLPIKGNVESAILYISGIVLIGFMFGFAYKLENKSDHKWVYRPVMSILSTLVFSWLIYYSALTIRKNIWVRG